VSWAPRRCRDHGEEEPGPKTRLSRLVWKASDAGGGQGFHQFRNSSLVVGDQAVVGHLEDRRIAVLVDGDDDLGVLHAGQVLDGAGNADGDVEFRSHDLAGLTHLIVVGGIARIDRSAGRADGGSPACRPGVR